MLVVGLGKSGLAAVRLLLSLGAKVSVSEGGRPSALDGEIIQFLQGKGVEYEVGGHSSDFFESADCILASPGVPLSIAPLRRAMEKGIPVVGELALAGSFLRTPVVAITGTNGKSTVTTLVGDMFRADGKKVFVGGNIGIPLAEYLLGPQDADAAVLEVSSFQLDTCGDFRPDVGVLLNITPDHLDRYDSFGAYAASKFRLFAGQQMNDAAVINADDPGIAGYLETHGHRNSLPGRSYFFSERSAAGHAATMEGKVVVVVAGIEGVTEGEERYDLSDSALSEAPNLQNSMAAILTARLMGVTPQGIQRSISAFAPLPHRMAMVAEINGVYFYDDSKATNIGAVQAALRGMTRPVVLIAGGRDKGGDYNLMRDDIASKTKGVVLIGEAREKMGKAFAPVTRIVFAESMQEAVEQAAAMAAAGDVVLLSPACASFDMFQSYAHRGSVFETAVAALKGKQGLLDDRNPIHA